jgi:hypothetical protein
MRSYLVIAASVGCLWCASAAAEKFTATCTCANSDPQHLLPAGDRPDHQLGVEAARCTWPKPMEIGGAKTKDSVATQVDDIKGDNSRFHGVHELTFDSGDKVALPYQGSGTVKNNQEISRGTFTFADGTGKLKGIKGNGTFSCKPAGGATSCEVEGEYELPR